MDSSRSILITGASGLLGRECLKEFEQDPQWKVLGLAYSRSGPTLRKVDLTNPDETATVIKSFKPSVILHSAAERRPDMVEKDPVQAQKLNIESTERLCKLASEVGAYVLFISTDYVFDGTAAPYKPDAIPNPLNKYGASKAEGEKIVMSGSPSNMVLRVPILYAPVEFLEESAVTILFTKVKDASKPAEMNHNEKRYPTSCADIARAIKVLVENRLTNKDLNGYFHWSGDEMMTKYDMAVAMADLFKIPTDHLIADTKPVTGAPRPYDCHLDCSRLEALGASHRTPFKTGIKEVLQKYYP